MQGIFGKAKTVRTWHNNRLGRQIERPGFTLLELMAVVATIAILAALLLPILSRAKIKAQRTACFSNLHQLGFAWTMYSTDNNSSLVPSFPGQPEVWVQGDMTKPAEAGNADLIKQGRLFHYSQSTSVYHCPTDRGQVFNGVSVPTVRSYSMNCFMGVRDATLPPIPETANNYVSFFAKESDLRRPSELWVLLDEDERSINDGFFLTDPTAHMWIDFPAVSEHRHNFSYGLNFADGHSEIWRHSDPRTLQVSINKTEQSGNADLARLARASTTAK
jgi:prepilin-type N-terminal cleavage/methylation domain-containing protein